MFSIYLQAHLLQAKYQLKKEWQAQAEQLKQVEQSQRKLQATAKAIAQKQQAIAKQRAAEREHTRRLNNKRFAQWVDNTAWAIEQWAISAKTIWLIVMLHWLVLFPSVGLLGLHYVLSGPCSQQAICRSVISFALRNPLKSPLR